ncbi:hypothetical protein IscW_ISCW002321, partial [Ixodes scapularis]
SSLPSVQMRTKGAQHRRSPRRAAGERCRREGPCAPDTVTGGGHGGPQTLPEHAP